MIAKFYKTKFSSIGITCVCIMQSQNDDSISNEILIRF